MKFKTTLLLRSEVPQRSAFVAKKVQQVFANPASVILITSDSAHVGTAPSSVCAATKAGFLSFAKTLSGKLLARGVRFNAVSPGLVETPLYDKLGIAAEI